MPINNFDYDSLAQYIYDSNGEPLYYLNWQDQVVDVVDTSQGIYATYKYNKSLTGLTLTKGRYKLYIKNPNPDIDIGSLNNFADSVILGKDIKRYRIDKAYYYGSNFNNLIIEITVIDNPIPVVVIWGAIIVAVSITGALSINSILEKIEPILSDVISSPLSYGILLIFLLPLVIPLFKK